MDKTAQKKTYRDPALNKIVQEKAAWNKEVSALINDLIHFKKSMNGWPSKYYKERTRITQPVPVDLSGILNQIANDFQELANRGNGILQEQAGFSKAHLKRKTDQTLSKLEQTHGPVDVPKAAPTPGAAPDLAQQLGKGASAAEAMLTKLAGDLEDKYFLEAQASNPVTRFVARLFNPKFGFGEAARMRRMRMTMLDNCASSFKTLKHLQAEVVKSSDDSLENSHKMMTSAWNQWNIVNRLFEAYRTLKPEKEKETGGKIEDPESRKAREAEEGGDPDHDAEAEARKYRADTLAKAESYKRLLEDYRQFSPHVKTNSLSFQQFNSIVEHVMAAPRGERTAALLNYQVKELYDKAIAEVNSELNTSGNSFKEIVRQLASKPKKEAQELQGFLGKTRHQLLPGGTSSPRLEIYNMIDRIKKDMDDLMDLLEDGFERERIQRLIGQINRQMSSLRIMIRSLFYSVRPDKANYSFF